jgi:transcriptional regulator with XRE-family HTH domain
MTNITIDMPKGTNFNIAPIEDAINAITKVYKNTLVTSAIAMELGISERTYYRYKNNIGSMPADKFIKLCIILQISPDEVLNTENYNPDIRSIIDNFLLSLD